MKLYIVIGIIFYENTEILGVYESIDLANKRKGEVLGHNELYDEVKIEDVELNEDIKPK